MTTIEQTFFSHACCMIVSFTISLTVTWSYHHAIQMGVEKLSTPESLIYSCKSGV